MGQTPAREVDECHHYQWVQSAVRRYAEIPSLGIEFNPALIQVTRHLK